MANESKKDFNAMLRDSKDMPKIQMVTDPKTIQKYGGARMYFAPPMDYDKIMRQVPFGRVITVGAIREHFARRNGADFTEPDETPYWRVLKAGGELNGKFPGGVQAQKARLEEEGHAVVQRGRTNLRYFVKDYEQALFVLE